MKIPVLLFLATFVLLAFSESLSGYEIMSTHVGASASTDWLELSATEVFGELEDAQEEGFEASYWEIHARRWMESWLSWHEAAILRRINDAGLLPQAFDKAEYPTVGYGGRSPESLSATERNAPVLLSLLLRRISPESISCPVYEARLTMQLSSLPAEVDLETLAEDIVKLLSSDPPAPSLLEALLVKDHNWYLEQGKALRLVHPVDEQGGYGYYERIMLYDDYSFYFEPLKPAHTIAENEFMLSEEEGDLYPYWRKGVWEIRQDELILYYPGIPSDDLDGVKTLHYLVEKESDSSFLLLAKEQ